MKVKENHQMDEEDDDIFTFERSPSPPPAPSVAKNKSDTSLAGTFKPSKGKRPMREPDSDDEDIQAATPSNKRSKVDDAPKHQKITLTSIPSTSDNGSGVNKTKEHNLAEVDGQKLAKRSKPSEINKAVGNNLALYILIVPPITLGPCGCGMPGCTNIFNVIALPDAVTWILI